MVAVKYFAKLEAPGHANVGILWFDNGIKSAFIAPVGLGFYSSGWAGERNLVHLGGANSLCSPLKVGR